MFEMDFCLNLGPSHIAWNILTLLSYRMYWKDFRSTKKTAGWRAGFGGIFVVLFYLREI